MLGFSATWAFHEWKEPDKRKNIVEGLIFGATHASPLNIKGWQNFLKEKNSNGGFQKNCRNNFKRQLNQKVRFFYKSGGKKVESYKKGRPKAAF